MKSYKEFWKTINKKFLSPETLTNCYPVFVRDKSVAFEGTVLLFPLVRFQRMSKP